MPAAARREHEHRRTVAGAAPTAQERQPIDLGQPEIEHDDVVAFGVGEEVCQLAVAGDIDGVAGFAERRRETFRETLFVFDQEQLHGIAAVITHSCLNAT